jgi:nitroreductase
MNVSEAVQTKRAVREFSPVPLPPAQVRAILNAGRRSQSSKNTQPWQFIALQEREQLTGLSKLGTYANHLAGAALGVAILGLFPDEKFQTLFDIGQTAAYMQLAAWEMGVGSCIASIYELDKARELLGFPAEWQLQVALSFGYPLDPAKLTQPNKKGGRRPLDEIVHWERW